MGKKDSSGPALIYPGIEFRPLTGIPVREKIDKVQLLPAPFKHLALADAVISFRTYDFGAIFSQQVQVRRQHVFWYHFFSISKDVSLQQVTEDPLVVLRYMLQGGVSYETDNRKLRVAARSYGMQTFGAGRRMQVDFSPGKFAWFDLAVPPDLFSGIPAERGPQDSEGAPALLRDRADNPRVLNISSTIRERIDTILFHKHSGSPGNADARIIREEQIGALLNQYMEDSVLYRRHGREAGELGLNGLKNYVLLHLADDRSQGFYPLDIRHVLRGMQLSEFHFRIMMQQGYHATWKKFVLRVRMERAAELLIKRPYIPMADISALLGYSERTHFTRAFHNYYGLTPKKYRLLHA